MPLGVDASRASTGLAPASNTHLGIEYWRPMPPSKFMVAIAVALPCSAHFLINASSGPQLYLPSSGSMTHQTGRTYSTLIRSLVYREGATNSIFALLYSTQPLPGLSNRLLSGTGRMTIVFSPSSTTPAADSPAVAKMISATAAKHILIFSCIVIFKEHHIVSTNCVQLAKLECLFRPKIAKSVITLRQAEGFQA